MVTRVYLSTHKGILSGEVSEDIRDRVSEYSRVFSDMDPQGRGEGRFEVKLEPVQESSGSSQPVFIRATAEETMFGHYGYEGWESLYSKYEEESGGTTVVFDSMIPYYAYEDQAREYTMGPEYEEILDSIHPNDRELFDSVFETYVESER